MNKNQKIGVSVGMILLGVTGYLIFLKQDGTKTQSATQPSKSQVASSSIAASQRDLPLSSNVKPQTSVQASSVNAPRQWVFHAAERVGKGKVVEMVPTMGVIDKTRPQALVKVGNDSYLMVPNSDGYFDRIEVAEKQKLNVAVYLPLGTPGEPIIVQVEDGGTLESGKLVAAKSVTLDSAQQLNFKVQVDSNPGIYRVLLRSGGNAQVLNFWVGPELPVSEPRPLVAK